jgi:hypothetical protein
MPRPKGSIKTPSLTKHKASGKAVVRIDAVDITAARSAPSPQSRSTTA